MFDAIRERNELIEKNKTKRGYIIISFIGIVMIGVVVVVSTFFVNLVRENVRDGSVNTIIESTNQAANMVSGRIRVEQNNILEHTKSVEKLSSLNEEGLAYIMGEYNSVDAPETLYVNGKCYPEDNVVEKENFLSGMETESHHIVPPHTSKIIQKKVIAFWNEVTLTDGVSRYLVKEIAADELNYAFAATFYQNQGYSYLIDHSGEILFHSTNAKGSNRWNNLLERIKEQNSAKKTDELLNIVNNRQSELIELSYEDEKSVFCFIPIGNTDWYMVSVVSMDIVEEQMNEIIFNAFVLVLVIIAAIVILLGMLIYREHMNLKQVQEKNRAERSEQNAIMAALSNIYFSSYYYDLTNHTYEELKSPEDIFNLIKPQESNAEEAIERYIDGAVVPQARKEMEEFLDLSTLGTRMQNVQSLSHDYESITRGWCRANWVAVTRDQDGNVATALYVVAEVDEEKRAEHEQKKMLADAVELARKANKAKSDFLSRMSHDIRTLMNVIVGMTEIAKRNADNPEKIAECIRKINIESLHLQSLINDVLDISAIEAGKLYIKPERTNLLELLGNIDAAVKSLANQCKVEYEMRIDTILYDEVNCDGVRVSQVCLNLLSNAVKYTEAGGKVCFEIRQSLNDKEHDGNYVNLNIRICDTGIGMSKEFLEVMYTEFARAVDTRVNRIQGTGLGLAIVKQLVDLMDGKIEVKSKEGIGTEFTVSIPMGYIEQEADGDETDKVHFGPNLFTGLRVLVAEDNDMNYYIVRELLGGYGMEVEQASNGQIAVEKLAASNPGYYNLIIMDMQMPVMDGVEATKKIRHMPQDYMNSIPIIAMTANAYVEDESECRNAGMNGFITKPIRIEQLLRGIKNILGMH